MQVQIDRNRLLLLTGLLLTIAIYLAIDQPAMRQSAFDITQAAQPRLALSQVAFAKLGQN